MNGKHRTDYRHRMTAHFCARCYIRFCADFPRVAGREICAECAYELRTGRMRIPDQHTDGALRVSPADDASARVKGYKHHCADCGEPISHPGRCVPCGMAYRTARMLSKARQRKPVPHITGLLQRS